MFLRHPGLVMATGWLLLLAAPAHAQRPPANDGFRRLNGQMQVVRNGQPRPMTRDAHLPTGATVTKDGFVVSADGQRTELREGQGCDLRGRPVAVRTAASGALTLGVPTVAAASRAEAPPTVLEQVFGPADPGRGFFKFKKAKKHHGKGKGHGRWKD
ncbi:DUF6799 domain-containing protein [Hymenobacter daeguensis]